MEIAVAFAYIKDRVESWAYRLFSMIEDIEKRGYKPMLIALSRKMPRFLDWVIETRANGVLPANIVKVISDVELTTELAIPFIFQSTDTSKYEFIILDDIIIYGSTLRNVSDDLYLLTNKESHVSCILRRQHTGYVRRVIQKEYEDIPETDEKEVESFIDSISTIVEEKQLPIDLEFPIFSIEEDGTHTYPRMVESIVKESFIHGIQTYIIGKNGSRFSMNLSSRDTVGSNNDFSKFRFFQKTGIDNSKSLAFEVISPMVIAKSDLLSLSQNLFEEEAYEHIWTVTTYGIRSYLYTLTPTEHFLKWDILKTNFARTLCVWASYLYSLSTYIKNASKIIPQYLRKKVLLRYEDLELVMGKVEASSIYPVLVSLIENEIVAVSFKDKVSDLPQSFSPRAFENELQTSKIISAFLSESVTDIFTDIFRYQHYSNPKFSNKYISFERPFFGETYDSLEESYKTNFAGPEYYIALHQWVDENIDMGYVVPKYEVVISKSGSHYWKRYFHPGIRKFKQGVEG